MKNEYMAVVKPANFSKAVKLMFEATDNSTAVDVMYSRVGAETTADIEEYELYQVLGDGRYLSVAFKPLTIVMPKEETIEAAVFTEQAYHSYRDAA